MYFQSAYYTTNATHTRFTLFFAWVSEFSVCAIHTIVTIVNGSSIVLYEANKLDSKANRIAAENHQVINFPHTNYLLHTHTHTASVCANENRLNF